MDLEGIMLSKICHTEKDKYCVISLVCGIYKTKWMNITKQKQSYRYRGTENKEVVARGEGVGKRNEIGEGDEEVQTCSCKINVKGMKCTECGI